MDTTRFQLVEIKGGLISDPGLELSLNLILEITYLKNSAADKFFVGFIFRVVA